jgi:hypothetical protein
MEEDKRLILEYRPSTLEEMLIIHEESLRRKKVSYIPHLLDLASITKKELESKTVCQVNEYLEKMGFFWKEEILPEVNYHGISTLRLIEYCDTLFTRKVNSHSFKGISLNDPPPFSLKAELEAIKSVLLSRKDLFKSILDYTKNKTFLDDLYYWCPDVDINDTLTFVLTLYEPSVLIKMYKEYLAECLITEREVGYELLKIIEERYPTHLTGSIDVMRRDKEIFGKEMVVSHSYWCERETDCTKVNYERTMKMIEESGIDFGEKGRKSGDAVYSICPCLCYIDVSLSGRREVKVKVSFECFEDLLAKGLKYRKYWKEMGVVDSDGEWIL